MPSTNQVYIGLPLPTMTVLFNSTPIMPKLTTIGARQRTVLAHRGGESGFQTAIETCGAFGDNRLKTVIKVRIQDLD